LDPVRGFPPEDLATAEIPLNSPTDPTPADVHLDMTATTLRIALVALLVAGGIARLSNASTPAREQVAAPAAHVGPCALGTSC
jgi:hypothetical protein